MRRFIMDFYIKNDKRTLREMLTEDFDFRNGNVPISGGWGYSLGDAIVIDKNDPCVNQNLPFDGVGLEYEIVNLRLMKEFLNSDKLDELYVGFQKQQVKQSLKTVDGRTYDHLMYVGYCFWENDFAMLDNFRQSMNFDEKEYQRKHEMLRFYFQTEYYFDVTSFIGKNQ